MATLSRDRDRERLEQELRTEEYVELLRTLQRRDSFFHTFTTWADVLVFMREGGMRDLRKDEVLRPILRFHSESEDPRLRGVLLAIFWPGLESIQVRKRFWDDDAEERWQNIAWTFFSVVFRVDVTKRPERLAQKIYNDTIHHLHDEYRRHWDAANREIATDLKAIVDLAGTVEGIDVEVLELRDAHARKIDRLREHFRAGRITESDFLLVAGTRLYGQSIAGYARGARLGYQVAKKRRQRAEAAIHRYEKEMR